MPASADDGDSSAGEEPHAPPAASSAPARPPSAGASAAAKRRKKKKKGGGVAAESADQTAQPDGLAADEDLDSILAELNLSQARLSMPNTNQQQNEQGCVAHTVNNVCCPNVLPVDADSGPSW